LNPLSENRVGFDVKERLRKKKIIFATRGGALYGLDRAMARPRIFNFFS
jgi:hypothetical protein